MEQFKLPLEDPTGPADKPEAEEPEVICPTCGMPKADGICSCNRPWTGPVRSPFKRSKKSK